MISGISIRLLFAFMLFALFANGAFAITYLHILVDSVDVDTVMQGTLWTLEVDCAPAGSLGAIMARDLNSNLILDPGEVSIFGEGPGFIFDNVEPPEPGDPIYDIDTIEGRIRLEMPISLSAGDWVFVFFEDSDTLQHPLASIRLDDMNSVVAIFSGSLRAYLTTLELRRERTIRSRLADQIERQEDRFRALVDRMVDVVFIVDLDTKIRFANAATQRVLGHQPSELSGTSVLELVPESDVAQVLDTTKEPEGFTLTGDEEVVSLHLYKEVGENTIETTAEVDKILDILGDQYPDLDYSFIYRDADFVKESFQGLNDSLKYGAILAFLVLFFFLMDWRSPIVVGLAIPVSILTTFAFLYFADVGLNLMSLGGLSLAAGMLVDNSIVVLENINRHLKSRRGSGETVSEVCAQAASEVASPVIAATLTTVAVFFPVIYVPGIAGEFFRDQALTVTISLLVSIFAALLLQPMLSARLLKSGGREPGLLFRPFDTAFRFVMDRYHALLEKVMGHKTVFLVLLVIALAGAGFLGSRMRLGFMPDRTRGDFNLALELPAGTPLEMTRELAGRLGSFLAPMPEVQTVYSQVGVTERTLASLKEYSAANTARLRVMLRPSRQGRRDMIHVKEQLQGLLDAEEGLIYSFHEEGVGLREILASGEAAFTLGIVAEKSSDALAAAQELLPRLREIPGLAGLEMDRVLGNPTIEVNIDREKALRFGLEPDQLAAELRNRIQGTVATTYNEIEQRIDIAVRLPLELRYDLSAVLASPVAIGQGKTVPLGSFVIQTSGTPVREIVRRDQRRQITIAGDVDGRSTADAWRDVHALLKEMSLPEGVAFVTGGEQEEINSSFRDLGFALLLSALLVYMILAAQFESFLDPLIISAVLPVGVGGALVTLALTGQTLNIISLIGIIALLGISVNDAIVKVATIRRLREDGLPGRQAILRASTLRFRPIIMTTMTTVLAMVPMGMGLGTGEQMQRPLALTIIGGLSIATLLTLFLTPVVYELLHRKIDKEY